jgi:hypothetical protein
MKKSEQILAAIFGLMFLVIVGGGLGKWAVGTWTSVKDDTRMLEKKLTEMAGTMSQTDVWQERSDWLDDHLPKFTSHEDASSKLFDTVQKVAADSQLSISAREMIPQKQAVEGEAETFFDQASVKLTFTDVGEKELFTWMHTLAAEKPHRFIGITRMQLQPGGKQHSVTCEVDVTQFFFIVEPAKVAKN